MKQRITQKDLEILTEEQKRRLNELWTPSIYDVAVAKVLKNVATDEYDEYEFVVGGISLFGTSIYLTDLVAGRSELQSQSRASDTETVKEATPADDPTLAVKVDPFFGESYPGFGDREDFNKASEGMKEALANDNGENWYEEEEEPEEEFLEEDLEDNYQHPATLSKSDCTPLLTIGNMIDILKNNNYGKFDFFLSAGTCNIGCELGRDVNSWGNIPDWEPAELCDVLWESVRELL